MRDLAAGSRRHSLPVVCDRIYGETDESDDDSRDSDDYDDNIFGPGKEEDEENPEQGDGDSEDTYEADDSILNLSGKRGTHGGH